jgi:hypothetical protein
VVSAPAFPTVVFAVTLSMAVLPPETGRFVSKDPLPTKAVAFTVPLTSKISPGC